jgi:hypothetical protein
MNDAISHASPDSSSGSSALETLLFESLSRVVPSTNARSASVADLPALDLRAFDRGDVRSNSSTVDDGGSTLSAAPSANDLNGHAQQAWGAQAAEWLSRAESRQIKAALAQQMALRSDDALALPRDHESPVVAPAAPTADAEHATTAAPLTAGNVRDGQAGGVLDSDRLTNASGQRRAAAG